MTTTPKANAPRDSSASQKTDYTNADGEPIPANAFENEIEARPPPLTPAGKADFLAKIDALAKKARGP